MNTSEKLEQTIKVTQNFTSSLTKTNPSAVGTTERIEIQESSESKQEDKNTYQRRDYTRQDLPRYEYKSSSYAGQEEHESYRSNVSLSSESSSNQNSAASEICPR